MGKASLVRALLVCSAFALATCSRESGFGANGADVSLAFQSAALTMREGDAPSGLTVVLTTSAPVLPANVSVEVVDLGTGSATSGNDYASFAPQRVTFAAGSVDGATAVVLLDPLDDTFVDAPGETVELGLRKPIRGVLGGTTQLTITLTDSDTAQVSFATAAGSSNEASAGQVALELECEAGVTLQVDASVRVSDLGTGTAVLLSDYAIFPEQTLTFRAGHGAGAVRIVSLALVDDTTPEVAETIELGLSQPSAACTLGAIQTHVLTIDDDDLAGDAALQASEGATGTENELAHDESIDLGTDGVGGSPSTGTLVRVANLGGQPMVLGLPVLAGSHPNDFAIELESSSSDPTGNAVALLARDSAGAFPAAAEAFAPLAALPRDSGPGVVLRVELAELARMRKRSTVALHGVELPELGPVTLELSRRPLPIAPDARLVIDGKEVAGGPRALLGDLQVWNGAVAGLADSRVFLAFDREGVQGFVLLPEPVAGIVHVFSQGPGLVRFVGEPELRSLGARLPDSFCAGERFPPGSDPIGFVPDDPDAPSTSALTLPNCRLAIETDFQLLEKLGSSSVLLTSYVTSQIAAVSEQFTTDVQTTLSIAYVGIHTTPDDGWDAQETPGADQVSLLDEFLAAWTAPNGSWPVEADLAHFLSGADLGGGVAYLGGLCIEELGFGVSADLNGNIDWLAWTGQAASFTWDFVVVAHELGHNFGAEHTHSHCPPLDECAPEEFWEPGSCQDETRCERGTIMSYCHLVCGGMSNMDLRFHPVTASVIRQVVNSSCLGRAALSPGDYVQYLLRFNPLTATGPRSATLLFSHDAPNVRRPFRVQLSGTAD